eukprot:g43884.t1
MSFRNAMSGDNEALVVADAWGEERSEKSTEKSVSDVPKVQSFSGGKGKLQDDGSLDKTDKEQNVNIWQNEWFLALMCFVGFVVTVLLGTLDMGLIAKDATMIATFFATQVALIQPSGLPFLAKVGRPWSMLAGACFMIMLADMSSEEAFVAIDLNTLALLFGASLLSANLEACQIQKQMIDHLMNASAEMLIIKISLIACVMAWIITNDGSSLIISPVALKILHRRPELPKLPIMLAVSASANIGSALLLNGNPQNILVDQFSEDDLTFSAYMVWASLPTFLCMAINCGLLLFLLKKSYPFLCCCFDSPSTASPTQQMDGEVRKASMARDESALRTSQSTGALDDEEVDEVEMNRYRITLQMACVAMIACFFIPSVRVSIGWVTSAVSIFVTAMYPIFTKKPASNLLALVDYELLLMFTGLFVVTGGMCATGVMDRLWEAIQPDNPFNPEILIDQVAFNSFILILSNSVGNVPAVLLLEMSVRDSINRKLSWSLLAWMSTIAGNFTLLGSAANVIVAAAAQKAGVTLTYSGYLKFGVISTLICMGLGMLWTNFLIAI